MGWCDLGAWWGLIASSSAVADLEDHDELRGIVDDVEDPVEVGFVAVDELPVGRGFGGDGSHARGGC